MPRRTDRSVVLDEILRLASVGMLTVSILIAPNAVHFFNKDVEKYLERLDEHERHREIEKSLNYLRSKKLISEDYKHGIKITDKARSRLAKLDFNSINLPAGKEWDGHWRIIFFDIPESNKYARDAFASHIRGLGFKVLQRSTFIYPYECRKEVEFIVEHFDVSRYVSYIEAIHVDNDRLLKKEFNL